MSDDIRDLARPARNVSDDTYVVPLEVVEQLLAGERQGQMARFLAALDPDEVREGLAVDDPEAVQGAAALAHYYSTYCVHLLHDACRGTCKICSAPCRCSCHRGEEGRHAGGSAAFEARERSYERDERNERRR